MIELYAMAVLRDLPFSKYSTSPAAAEVIKDLNGLSNFQGPTRNGRIVPDLLFRGSTNGDLTGPYISQFLYLPFSHGAHDVAQKYRCYEHGVDYMTSWEETLSCQNGAVVGGPLARKEARYIITLRDGATYVHLDDTLQLGQQAALILNRLKCPGPKGSPFGRTLKTGEETGDPCHPNSVKEKPFVDLGILDLYDVMCGSIRSALMSAWYHKWSICRLRPEELGMIVQRLFCGGLPQEKSPLHPDLLDSDLLTKVHRRYGTYLLPQVYPEGAPCHPSYPSGHAVYAGAVATILKAFYDEDFMIDAYAPNEDGSELLPLGYKLRVGDELDKMASNATLLRNAAGIHYRSDSQGIELGEEIAIILLNDYVLRYTQNTKFSFHRRNGRLVEISNTDEEECNDD